MDLVNITVSKAFLKSLNKLHMNNMTNTHELPAIANNAVIQSVPAKSGKEPKCSLVTLDDTPNNGLDYVLVSKSSGVYNIARNRIAANSKHVVIKFPTNQAKPGETWKVIINHFKKLAADAVEEIIRELKHSDEYASLSPIERATKVKALRSVHCPIRIVAGRITLIKMDSAEFMESARRLVEELRFDEEEELVEVKH